MLYCAVWVWAENLKNLPKIKYKYILLSLILLLSSIVTLNSFLYRINTETHKLTPNIRTNFISSSCTYDTTRICYFYLLIIIITTKLQVDLNWDYCVKSLENSFHSLFFASSSSPLLLLFYFSIFLHMIYFYSILQYLILFHIIRFLDNFHLFFFISFQTFFILYGQSFKLNFRHLCVCAYCIWKIRFFFLLVIGWCLRFSDFCSKQNT